MALLSNMLLQHSHAWHTSGLSKYAYNVSGIILLSSFPKAVLHRIRAFEGGPGSTGAPTTGACSSSVSGTRRAKGKPCMEAEANKKMQTLHSQLKKRHFMTARAQEAVACLVTAEHYKTCCLHHITEPQSDLKCSRTAICPVRPLTHHLCRWKATAHNESMPTHPLPAGNEICNSGHHEAAVTFFCAR